MKTLNELKRKGKQVKGKWQLDDRHVLSYIKEDGEEEAELDISLVAAEENALVVSISGKQERGRMVTSLAKLKGKWRLGQENQLEFEVARKRSNAGTGASKAPDTDSAKARALAKSDVLTFTGSWKAGKSNELIFTYKTSRVTRHPSLATLIFKGYWELGEKNWLTYLVEGSSDNAFRFRGAFQTQSILAKKGEIRYQLGAEAGGKRGKFKTITLFGKFKISDKLELIFEMDCADGKKRELRFGAEYALTDDCSDGKRPVSAQSVLAHRRKCLSVSASLINKAGEPLGVEVVLTKDFLKTDAKAFVRLKKTLAESAVEAGVTIPW